MQNNMISVGNSSLLPTENVVLQQYYYGEREPPFSDRPFKKRRLNRPKYDSEMDVHVKCTACPKVFKKNSEIIPHLYEHIEQDEETGQYVFREKRHPLRQSNLRCPICMKKTSMDSISTHIKHSHEMKNHEYTCRICELYYRNGRELVTHMHLTHPCMDMPYSCEICGYMTSFRVSAFKHFEETHQKNYVMCSFCMMIMPVETVPDMKMLEEHLMQHVLSNEKCTHCSLKFTCDMDHRDHSVQKHKRLPDTTKIEEIKIYKLSKGEEPIMMRRPVLRNKDPRNRDPQQSKLNNGSKTINKTVPVPAVAADNDDSGDDDGHNDDGFEIVFERLVVPGSVSNEENGQNSSLHTSQVADSLKNSSSNAPSTKTVPPNSENSRKPPHEYHRRRRIPAPYLNALGLIPRIGDIRS